MSLKPMFVLGLFVLSSFVLSGCGASKPPVPSSESICEHYASTEGGMKAIQLSEIYAWCAQEVAEDDMPKSLRFYKILEEAGRNAGVDPRVLSDLKQKSVMASLGRPSFLDADKDGLYIDNCPMKSNLDQKDTDGDGVGDACDNCPRMKNPSQADLNGDGIGNRCEKDKDKDGIIDHMDNCPNVKNTKQGDADKDKVGDACDDDADMDGIVNSKDNCPTRHNPDQANADSDTQGDVCDDDLDNDGKSDEVDNCLDISNPTQKDADADGVGDACDNCPAVPNPEQKGADKDRDRIVDDCDNAPNIFNPGQGDEDHDGIGDVADNCPMVSNTDQTDSDGDRVGDVCDNCPAVSNTLQKEKDACASISIGVGEESFLIRNRGIQVYFILSPGIFKKHSYAEGKVIEGWKLPSSRNLRQLRTACASRKLPKRFKEMCVCIWTSDSPSSGRIQTINAQRGSLGSTVFTKNGKCGIGLVPN
ncbi:MAG: hypothetical protein HOE80_02790 [Candidatus Magasanikbacteria bacterium]|jgi:hypothetical protein|nr:hypothetical protein [Candidatus Magasanikbacteria bacterium]MBT4071625.1 hypothetical protein [Candidatus Magasanikbacteria bacterium]